jgi:hypothetical protein
MLLDHLHKHSACGRAAIASGSYFEVMLELELAHLNKPVLALIILVGHDGGKKNDVESKKKEKKQKKVRASAMWQLDAQLCLSLVERCRLFLRATSFQSCGSLSWRAVPSLVGRSSTTLCTLTASTKSPTG